MESPPRKEQSTESVSPNLINQSSPEASIVGAATSTSQLSKTPESITSQLSKTPESITSQLSKTPESITSANLIEEQQESKSKTMAMTATAAKQEMCESNSLVAADDEHEIETDNDNDNDNDNDFDEQQQRNWDNAWRSRFLKTIFEDKKQRQLDLQNIEYEKRKLDQQRRQIEKAQHDLEIKESKFVKYEPLIPSVKEIMDMGITFDLILPYMRLSAKRPYWRI